MRVSVPLIASSALILFGPCAIADPELPAPLAAAIETEDRPVYAFDLHVIDGETELKGRLDATKPEGARFTLSDAYPETSLTKEDRAIIKTIDEGARGEIFCDQHGDLIGTAVSELSRTEDTITYSFEPQPEDESDEKIFKNLRGEVTVWTENPDVKSIRMYAPKSFKPAMVAKIDAFDMTISCVRGPDGHAVRAAITQAIEGSAMGQSIDQSSTYRVSNIALPD